MSKGYDVQCAVLAEHFLQGHEYRGSGDTAALAQAIQDAVEDYMRNVDGRSVADRGVAA